VNSNLTIGNLIATFKDADQIARIHAAMVLSSKGRYASEAVSALIDLLETGTIQDKRVAALTLGEIGPVAKNAIPALTNAVDEDETLFEHAIWALEMIDDEEEMREAA